MCFNYISYLVTVTLVIFYKDIIYLYLTDSLVKKCSECQKWELLIYKFKWCAKYITYALI